MTTHCFSMAVLYTDVYVCSHFCSIQCVQNLGLAVLSIVAGKLVDSYGYLALEVCMCVQLSVILLAAILLYVLDASSSHGGTLNLSAWARKKVEISKKT